MKVKQFCQKHNLLSVVCLDKRHYKLCLHYKYIALPQHNNILNLNLLFLIITFILALFIANAAATTLSIDSHQVSVLPPNILIQVIHIINLCTQIQPIVLSNH